MNETKLKPCPFCGGEKLGMFINLFAEIWCEDCQARITRRIPMGKYDCIEDARAGLADEIINTWNRRATNERAD